MTPLRARQELCDGGDGPFSPTRDRDINPVQAGILAQPCLLVPDVSVCIKADTLDGLFE